MFAPPPTAQRFLVCMLQVDEKVLSCSPLHLTRQLFLFFYTRVPRSLFDLPSLTDPDYSLFGSVRDSPVLFWSGLVPLSLLLAT